jgi:hypothetical protein
MIVSSALYFIGIKTERQKINGKNLGEAVFNKELV